MIYKNPSSEVGSYINTKKMRREKMKVIAVHKWTEDVHITMIKEMIEGFTDLLEGTAPEGIKLCFTWQRPDYGAFCLWDVPSVDALEKFFKKFGPTMLNYTEFVQVSQVYPPSMEYVLSLFQAIVDMASQ
jgi:hypothetical protein